MTGPDLRKQRNAQSIKASALAAKMGVGRTRIPQIEAQAVVSEEILSRYLQALVELAAERKAAS